MGLINGPDKRIETLTGEFSEALTAEIAKQLGITPDEAASRSFTDKELAQIKQLKLKSPHPGDLAGIEHLPNLEYLWVGKINPGVRDAFNSPYSIDNSDIKRVEQCKNLSFLLIQGQNNITQIDLSGLTKLEALCLSQDRKLKNINGLESLHNLQALSCMGNKNLEEIPHLDTLFANHAQNLNEVELDVLLFPKAIGYNVGALNRNAYDETKAYNHKAMENLDKLDLQHPIRWCEDVDLHTCALNHTQMKELHNTAGHIMDRYIPQNRSVRDTIVGVELLLAKSVKYDHNGLQQAQSRHSENGQLVGPEYGTNSAYNALIYKSCICEGYVRAAQYMLALRGIKTYNVYCQLGKKENHLPDADNDFNPHDVPLPNVDLHSIIRYKDYYNLYSDICGNAEAFHAGNKSMPYTFLSKEQTIEHCDRSSEEKGIDHGHYSPSTDGRSGLDTSIASNIAFMKAGAGDVKQMREAVAAECRGDLQSLRVATKVSERS